MQATLRAFPPPTRHAIGARKAKSKGQSKTPMRPAFLWERTLCAKSQRSGNAVIAHRVRSYKAALHLTFGAPVRR